MEKEIDSDIIDVSKCPTDVFVDKVTTQLNAISKFFESVLDSKTIDKLKNTSFKDFMDGVDNNGK